MKKVITILIVFFMLLSTFIIAPEFVGNVSALEEHGASSGDITGEIQTTDFPLVLDNATHVVTAVAFSPDGEYIAYGGFDDIVYIHYTSNWTKVTELTNASGNINSIDFSYNNSQIAYGSSDDNVYIHNTTTWDNVTYLHESLSDVNAVAFSPNGSWVAYTGTNLAANPVPVVFVHYTSNWTVDVELTEGAITSVAYSLDWSSDSDFIAHGTSDNIVYVHYTSNWTKDVELTEATSNILGISFSDNDTYIAYCGADSKTYIHNIETSGWSHVTTLAEAGSGLFCVDFSGDSSKIAYGSIDNIVYVHNASNWDKIAEFTEAGATVVRAIAFSSNNEYIAYGSNDFELHIHSIFNVTRIAGGLAETNAISFNPIGTYSSNVTLKVPVSSSVQGIINVTNNTCGNLATEVNNSDELVNGSFWYDSANQYVYIRTINLSSSITSNWTIYCSYGATFNLIIPEYLDVGQYFHSEGYIENSTGHAISDMIAETRLLYANGTDALSVNPKHNCTNGNYYCTFSTSSLIPGTYSVSIEFTDPASGIMFKEGGTLYLSVDPGSGVHVWTSLHFTFYNNNTGIGMPSESFKIYASIDTTVDSDDRIYVDLYGVYTGQTIYYRIDDFFDNQIYPTTGSYETLCITSINQYEEVPIDWYSFSVKNMNHSIVWFNMTNDTRTYSTWLFPYEPFYWDVLEGEYNLSMRYYDTSDDSYQETKYQNITIEHDEYYWIRGYDLQDIIIEVQLTNATINALNISITADISFVNSTVGTITTDIISNLTLTESNLTTLINSYSSNFTVIESIVNSMNTSIWANFTYINATVDTINNKLTINFTMLNNTIDWMNTSIWTNFTLLENNISDMNLSITNMIVLTENNITSLIITIENIIDYALTPDVTIISRNPPMIRSCYEKKGMPLGNNIWIVDPVLNIWATTRNETFGNYINSTPIIPDNGTVANGTITITSDTMYISGNGTVAWVNITYTDNGTLYQNTTYIPSKINLYGENLTINASCNIHVQRETEYSQEMHFGWLVEGDTGRHTYTIDVENLLGTPLYDVYVYVAFSNESTPDENTVSIIDVANGNINLSRDEDFKTVGSGIEFYLLSVDINETREFAISYYWSNYEQLNYDTAIIYIDDYKTKQSVTFDDRFFNSFTKPWVNDEATTFRGEIFMALDFDKSNEIETSSIHIWDVKNSRMLDRSLFFHGTGSIMISSDAIGDVSPGGGREFTVYFRFMEYPGADPTEWHLNTMLFPPLPITVYLIIFLLALISLGCGIYIIMSSKNKKKATKGILLVGIGLFIIVVFFILQAKGT